MRLCKLRVLSAICTFPSKEDHLWDDLQVLAPSFNANGGSTRRRPVLEGEESTEGASFYAQPTDGTQLIVQVRHDDSNFVEILTGVVSGTGYWEDAFGVDGTYGAQWAFGNNRGGQNATVRIWGRIVAIEGTLGNGTLVTASRIIRTS